MLASKIHFIFKRFFNEIEIDCSDFKNDIFIISFCDFFHFKKKILCIFSIRWKMTENDGFFL